MQAIIVCFPALYYTYVTVVEICLYMKASIWSKTSLNTGGVGGARADPPSCKMGTFFLMSLTLTEPIFNNFQLNGAKMF